MIDCISVENMRLSDAQTIAELVPSLELMGRAAYGVYLAGVWKARTAIVAGSGNNGGDGFALACILQAQGHDCAVFTLSRKLSPDSAHYAARAKAAGVPIQPFTADCLTGFGTVVDCLLGTGFRGAVRDDYRAAIEAINASGANIISVDINSGLNGDTGEGAPAVRSDLTVTIGYVKNGLLTEHAGDHMKRLVCADIGIRLAYRENQVCSPEEWAALENPGQQLRLCPDWLDMGIIKAY